MLFRSPPYNLPGISSGGGVRCPLTKVQHSNLANEVFTLPSHFAELPLQYAFGQSPSKVVPQAWQCASCPDRGQHHFKVTPALGRGKDTTHISKTVAPTVGLGADGCYDCRLHPPMKFSQGTKQRKHPVVWCYCNSGKMPGLTQFNLKEGQVWPTNTTGTKYCPQQKKRGTANN